MKKRSKNSCPAIIRGIQVLNYIAATGSALSVLIFLFASNDFLREFNNGIETENRLIVATGYLAIAFLAGLVIYKFRKRDKYAPELYVLANVLGFAFFEMINHFSGYRFSVYEYFVIYFLEALIMAYLLFNEDAKVYFGKSSRG